MTAGLVHLTVVPNAYEAELLCALLRTEGLTCDLRPTNLGVGMMDGLPGGGPKEIVVAEQDLARAQEILRLQTIDPSLCAALGEPAAALLVATDNGALP